MYSFEPNEEQQMLLDAVNRYALNDLRAKAHDADEEGLLPPPLVRKGWELGFLQASIPEEFGGFGERSVVTGALAAEEMAYGDLTGALAVMTPGLFAMPVALVGSQEQKESYLPVIVEGDWCPYTAALIEASIDFDANALKTVAQEDGDEYVINGEKIFVPYAEGAEAMIVYARLGTAHRVYRYQRHAGLKIVFQKRSYLCFAGL
jgi:alkylation response protein AidB-like acyl-CoA dehydrogenase